MAFPKVINPASPQDSDSPSQGAAILRQVWQMFVDLFGLPANTAISGPIQTMGSNTDGKMATAPVLKNPNPYIRVIGTETSGHDYRWYSDSGNLRLQLNTASELAPSWSDLIIQALAASPSNQITLGPLAVAGNETVNGNLTVTGTITGHATSLDALTLAALLTCNGGLTSNTLITANAGISANSITTGTLTASGQITANGGLVANSLITANNGLSVSAITSGPIACTTLTTSGTYTANAAINATQGLTAGGTITANAGLSANSITCSGNVGTATMTATGAATIGGLLTANAGITVNGGSVVANAGLSTTTLTVTGNANISGTLGVTGAITSGATASLGALLCTVGGVTCKGIILQGATGLQTDGATSGQIGFTAPQSSSPTTVTVSLSPSQPDANYKVHLTLDTASGVGTSFQVYLSVANKSVGGFDIRIYQTNTFTITGTVNWLLFR